MCTQTEPNCCAFATTHRKVLCFGLFRICEFDANAKEFIAGVDICAWWKDRRHIWLKPRVKHGEQNVVLQSNYGGDPWVLITHINEVMNKANIFRTRTIIFRMVLLLLHLIFREI
ncbi:hypothetical protein FKM82_003275 [Ascaphus truei]